VGFKLCCSALRCTYGSERKRLFTVAREPLLHEIEFGDYSEKSGLLPKASLELDEHLSMHPALRDTSVAGDKIRSLRLVVANFTGYSCSTGTAMKSVCSHGRRQGTPCA